MTPAGSFRCENTFRLARELPEKERELFRGVCIKAGFASVAVVPIRRHEAIVGAIHFADERERMTPPEMIGIVESTLSPIIGEAVHRFDMETELRALSSELTLAEERARRELAVALHDTVGQTLALTKIKLGSLGQTLADKKARNALAEIREMFDEGVRQTRTLSFELSPPILYELGLGAAIEWLGEDFARRHGLQVHFEGTGQPCEITETTSVLLFQSARELFVNVAKHASAEHVHVSLKVETGRVLLAISDDGKGMEDDTAGNGRGGATSLGLFSIRERMRHIGGTFEIQSRRGHGTKVTLAAPLRSPKSPVRKQEK
jgi:signal transduction histidine kinase